MSGKLISLAEFESTKRAQHPQAQTVTAPLRDFQTLQTKAPVEIMQALTAHEVILCQQIGFRGRDLMRQIRASLGGRPDEVLEMNPAITSIDFAVVWAFREGYDFMSMLRADNLVFTQEFTTVQQNIVRAPLPFFSRDVRLRFACNGARVNPV